MAFFAQGCADFGGYLRWPNALVENQVEPSPRPRRAARPLHREGPSRNARRLSRNARFARVMRCSIAARDQECGARSVYVKPETMRRAECDFLLRRRQLGMAGRGTKQPQDGVAIMRAVEPFRQRILGVVELGKCIVLGQRLLLAARLISSIAIIASDHDPPRRGIARRAVLRPSFSARAKDAF